MKQKGTDQSSKWDQSHLFSSMFHKIIMSCFLLTFMYAAQAQQKFSIYGGIQRTIPFRKILVDPPGNMIFRNNIESSGLAGGLKYAQNLYPFLSVSGESGYAGYSFLMSYNRTRIDHHYVQGNLSVAFHPFYKSRFIPLHSLFIGGGPGLNYLLGTNSNNEPYNYPNNAKWIVNAKISTGISFYNFTISPYWITFLTHFNDTDYGNFRFKDYLKAYGVSLSYDIIRKAKTESPPITPYQSTK